jgi:hypothetical protein
LRAIYSKLLYKSSTFLIEWVYENYSYFKEFRDSLQHGLSNGAIQHPSNA